MNPIETIATITAVIILVKMALLYLNPKPLFKLGRSIMQKAETAKWVYLIIALIVGQYLIDALSIVEIMAVLLFSSLLYGASLMSYAKGLEKFYKVIEKDHILQKAWAPVLIYVLISFWVLWTLFGQ